MTVLWLEFLIASGVIVYCGTNLARYGDVIAEKTGLGRAWIGLILMSGVTSLPELITGVSSVAFAGVPDIAVGDVMGSCVFNLSLIALMDMLHGPKPIFPHAEHSHILSAGFGAILMGVAVLSIAAWLPFIGDQLAEATGLGRSFVGSILVAMTTSLPELAVSISALKIGAADMAIANLLGSNLFNMVILAIDDLAYTQGPLFSAVSQNHAITGTTAVIMTGIVVVSLMYRLEKKTALRIGGMRSR